MLHLLQSNDECPEEMVTGERTNLVESPDEHEQVVVGDTLDKGRNVYRVFAPAEILDLWII